jgi:uncharacterized protein YgbK (DUF1537 family)
MSRLLLTFYGDDFTGSTDTLEQLTRAGIRTVLFIEPPGSAQLKKFPGLQAIGVAGMTRSMTPTAMENTLRPALAKLKALGARHVHYKVCSTFDSSPTIGSIGRVMAVARELFAAPFIPILAAAPALGRYTIFGTHFARYGIGSAGEIHRLDRHPSISKHPITPMTEADLRLHLGKQTKKQIALFDILKVALPEKDARAALTKILAEKPDAVLFDAVQEKDLKQIGGLIDAFASNRQPLFSIGSSGIEIALATHFDLRRSRREAAQTKRKISPRFPAAATTVLIGSGSCSPVTAGQINWALNHGFSEVALNAPKLASNKTAAAEITRAASAASQMLESGRSVIVHTTRGGADRRVAAKLKNNTAQIFGTALGNVFHRVLEQCPAGRLCIAGGDTSSFAARALGIEALEMIAPLTPGAPLCRAISNITSVNGIEVVFKGGQVGAENYFEILKRGKA